MGKGSIKQRLLIGYKPNRNSGEAHRNVYKAYPFECCAWCGMRSDHALELAHIDHNALNNDPDNLVWLCANDHKSLDTALLDVTALKFQRARWQITKGVPDHKPRMKDAGVKAVATRRRNNEALLLAAATKGPRNNKSTFVGVMATPLFDL